jgi:hypothetical protein
MIKIQDTGRTLQFEGTMLGESSSWRQGATRWVEFALYRTEAGTYVLSRVGQTMLYHDLACPVVERNNLDTIPSTAVNDTQVPCPDCQPNLRIAAEVAPEAPRHWALVSETPEGILDSLYRYDETGTRYLTSVAQRLLTHASEKDPRIAGAYRTETIA